MTVGRITSQKFHLPDDDPLRWVMDINYREVLIKN
jgi:hypothetical protein